MATPAASHGVGLWFRPVVAQRLTARGIRTLGELVAYCNRYGGSWWRSVPRIGALRARLIVAWLRRHEATICETVEADVEQRDPLVGADETVIQVGASSQVLAPLERLSIVHPLSGADGAHRGINRAAAFSYLAARHDLEAVRAYLHQYRDRPATLRMYTKELERFVLWAVCVRGKAVSSLLIDDCEAYRDFLAAPAAAFTGPRAPRSSNRWRPFAPGGLSADSQRYAVCTLRAAFAWLVDVRYLAGNPWAAVRDPLTLAREEPMQVDRALALPLWERIRRFMDVR